MDNPLPRLLVWALAVLCHGGASLGAEEPSSRAAAGGEREMRLPPGAELLVHSLRVSANGQTVCYLTHSEFKERTGFRISYAGHILDLKKGTTVDPMKLLPDRLRKSFEPWSLLPSPDGRRTIVSLNGRLVTKPKIYIGEVSEGRAWWRLGYHPFWCGGGTQAYVVSLDGAEAHKVGGHTALWWGDRIALSKTGSVYTAVTVMEKDGNGARPFPVRGLPLAGDVLGKSMVMVQAPKVAGMPFEPKRLRLAHKAVVVAPDGNAVSVAGSPPIGPADVVISPSGTYLAYRNAVGKKDQSIRFELTVFSRDGKPKFAIRAGQNTKEALFSWDMDKGDLFVGPDLRALAVTDDGRLVTMASAFGSGKVEMWSGEGQAVTLVPDAKSAAVGGDRLYYVTSGEQPMIESIALPRGD